MQAHLSTLFQASSKHKHIQAFKFRSLLTSKMKTETWKLDDDLILLDLYCYLSLNLILMLLRNQVEAFNFSFDLLFEQVEDC